MVVIIIRISITASIFVLWPVLRTLLTGSPLTLSLVLQSKYHKKSCVVDGGFETQKMWTVLSKVLCLGRGAVRT